MWSFMVLLRPVVGVVEAWAGVGPAGVSVGAGAGAGCGARDVGTVAIGRSRRLSLRRWARAGRIIVSEEKDGVCASVRGRQHGSWSGRIV